MHFKGHVARKPVGGESKSAHAAVVLEVDDDDKSEYVLRIQGGNAFSDPRLDALVGKSIDAEGVVHRNVLIITTWKEV